MSYKTERLLQRINQLQDYLSGNGRSHPLIEDVSREAVELAHSLSEEKLTVNIVRCVGEEAAMLEKYLSDRLEIKNDYRVRAVELPQSLPNEEGETPPALILQDPEASPVRQTSYTLESESSLVVGRDPSRAGLIIAGSFSRVSGRHATVESIAGPGGNGRRHRWQVRDEGSKNGTFVNGVRVEGRRILQPGDQIVLGGPFPDSKQAALTFQYKPVDRSAGRRPERGLINCDALCIVTTEDDLGSDIVRTILEKARTTGGPEIFVLTRAISFLVAGEVDAVIGRNDEWDHLQARLTDLAKKKEDILLNRATRRLNEWISLLDSWLAEEEENLSDEYLRESEKLGGLGVEDLKERMKASLRQIANDNDAFFRQVRIDLGLAKVSAIDSFNKQSIVSKIQAFIDGLQPVVHSKNGAKYLRLAAAGKGAESDVALTAFSLCQSELENWVNRQWDKVVNHYAGGGIQELYRRIESSLTAFSSAATIDSITPPVRPPVSRELQESIMPGAGEALLREESLVMQVFKNFRSSASSLMSLVGLAVFIIPMFIGPDSPTERSGSINSRAVISNMISSNPELKIIALIMMASGIAYIVYNYQVSHRLNRDELRNGLRREMQNYYQSYAKDRIDRLVQGLALALDAEDRRLKAYFDRVAEQISMRMGEIRKSLDEIKSRQVAIGRERTTIKALGR